MFSVDIKYIKYFVKRHDRGMNADIKYAIYISSYLNQFICIAIDMTTCEWQAILVIRMSSICVNVRAGVYFVCACACSNHVCPGGLLSFFLLFL